MLCMSHIKSYLEKDRKGSSQNFGDKTKIFCLNKLGRYLYLHRVIALERGKYQHY